jgi:DNA-binding protein H-NS
MQDLSAYSISQLRKIQAEVDEELKKRHFLGVSQAREQILHIAQSAGLSMKDILSGRSLEKSTKQPLAAKYRHPDDTAKQWSGRGRKPTWVKEWVSSGRNLSEAEV